jgi:dolichol kinase
VPAVLARLHDPILALVSIGLVALLLRFVRWAQTARPLPPFLFRKVLHAVVGGVTLLFTIPFHHRGWAMVPPAVFTLVNAIPRYRPGIPGLASSEREARGLWMFPLGVCLVDFFFWSFGHRGAVFAGIAALAVGDPAAALVGTRLGQRRYTRWAHGRTVEGSIAFLLTAGIVTAVVAAICPGGPAPLRAGVGCGLIGALAEALSPAGADNLTIPLAVAFTYQLLA